MQVSQKVQIVGAKRSKGEYEGRPYDATKVYVPLDLNNSTDQGRGAATVEYSWGTSENYDKIKHLPFPFEAEVELAFVTNGKGGMIAQFRELRPVKADTRKAA